MVVLLTVNVLLEDLYEQVGESVAAESQLVMNELLTRLDVLLGRHGPLLDGIDEVGGELVAFAGPFGLGLRQGVLEALSSDLRADARGDLSELIPGVLAERSREVLVELVDARVPKGVQLIDTVLLLQEEQVSTHITVGMLLGVARHCVQRLVHVTEVVDKKAQVHTIAEQPRDTALIILLGLTLVATALSVEHASHVIDGPSDVEVLRQHCGIETLVHECLIDVMPRANVIEADILNVVGEGRTLNKSMVLLVLVEVRERL